MKAIKKLEKRETTYYVATDGRVFSSYQDCRRYEKDLTDKENENAFSTLRSFEIVPLLAEDGTDEVWVWVYLTSEEDYQKALNYLYDEDNLRYIPKKYGAPLPRWVAFSRQYYGSCDGKEIHGGYVVGSLDYMREEAEDYFRDVEENIRGCENGG